MRRCTHGMIAMGTDVNLGYRGAEPSVMEHLFENGAVDSNNFRHGLYWCCINPENLHPAVTRLREKLGANFRLVQVSGFDELMEELDNELGGETWYSAGDEQGNRIQSSLTLPYDSRPAAGVALDDLDHDLILSTFTEYCKRLKLGTVDKSTVLALMREQGLLVNDGGTLVPTIGSVLLFGKQTSDTFLRARVDG